MDRKVAPAVTLVETSGGRVRGVETDGVHRFLGVRYGTAERFRPPSPASWDGVFDAMAFGPAAPPTLTKHDRAFFTHSRLWREYAGIDAATTYSEDCLRLNVWTAGVGDARRPVLFWLHGGGFSWGSGAGPWTHGDRLAARQDIVVVTINHRLGVLGYLDLEDAVGDAWRGSGVAGLLDLELGLRWVRDNIARFGGDAANVTIAGHSGGGAKVAALLALPSAEGLFVRTIIQSGVVSLDTVDRDEGVETAKCLLDRAGGIDALCTMGADDLTRLAADLRFRPVARTSLLPAHPFVPVAAPSAANVPLLIGTTTDDSATFKFDAHPQFGSLDERLFCDWVAGHSGTAFGELAAEAIGYQRSLRPNDDLEHQLVALATARLRERTESLIARKLAGGHTPVYVYNFAYAAPMPDDTLFAGESMSSHGIELPFVFDVADRVPHITGNAPERDSLSALVSTCWAAFARNGDPGWPPWDFETRQLMVFDAASGVRRDPFEAEQPLFDRLRGTQWTTSASI